MSAMDISLITKYFERTERAIVRLESVKTVPLEVHELILDGVIKRFEFSLEMSWKLFRRLMVAEGLEINSPRDALAEAYRAHIIQDREIWEQMIRDRNLTAHTYDDINALEIYGRIKLQYVDAFRDAFERAKKHFEKLKSFYA